MITFVWHNIDASIFSWRTKQWQFILCRTRIIQYSRWYHILWLISSKKYLCKDNILLFLSLSKVKYGIVGNYLLSMASCFIFAPFHDITNCNASRLNIILLLVWGKSAFLVQLSSNIFAFYFSDPEMKEVLLCYKSKN